MDHPIRRRDCRVGARALALTPRKCLRSLSNTSASSTSPDVREGRTILRDSPYRALIGAYLTSGLATTAACEWDNPQRAPAGDVARCEPSESDRLMEWCHRRDEKNGGHCLLRRNRAVGVQAARTSG